MGLDTRYTATWNEIHTRVEARQNVRIQFAVVAIGSAVAALSTPGESGWVAVWTSGFAFAMPLLTWAFALWARHSDLTIGLLSRFCAACEEAGDQANLSGLPGWHRGDQGWMTEARRIGRLSDLADILLVLLTSFPAWALVGRSWLAYTSTAALPPLWVSWLLLVAQLSVVPFIWSKRSSRTRISTLRFTATPTGWKLSDSAKSNDPVAQPSTEADRK